MRTKFLYTILFSACLLFAGCSSMGYYMQSINGQLDIWRKGEPIETVLNNPAAPEALKQKLASVLRIREFASTHLQLPDNRSYRLYADLQRPEVVWNVFATPELSIKPMDWCFPIAGCVNYRGYFSKADAEAFAEALRRQGYDVYVGGVPAYSTLGWFDDPVLNTFVNYSETELARLIFHELAHQTVYAPGDSVFNESFAVSVEQEGVRRWLEYQGNVSKQGVFDLAQKRRRGFSELIGKYREQLEKTFSQPISDDSKRREKARVYEEMHAEYQSLKNGWGNYAGYDRWFDEHPNNANLASVSLYAQMVPAFQQLLVRQDGDLRAFYAAVKQVAKMSKNERAKTLADLMPESSITTAEINSVFQP